MNSKSSLKILFITRNMPPITGGMERLNYHAYLELKQKFQIAVCGPSGVKKFITEKTLCSEAPSAPLWKFLTVCQLQSWKAALCFKPDIIYSGSGLTAPASLFAARTSGAQSVCYLHGLDIIANHPLYRSLFLPAIKKFDFLIFNSHYTASLAKEKGIPEHKGTVIHPGVRLPDMSMREKFRKEFRHKYELDNRPMLLTVGRITERKGFVPFIRRVMPEIIKIFPDVFFAIVGEEASLALKHRKGIGRDVLSAIESISAENNIILLGSIDDCNLSRAYFAADVLVFPVLDLPGDIEGFGMVAIEAASHGLPTVAFNVGGVSDAVMEGVSGHLVNAGDYSAMTMLIIDLLKSRTEFARSRRCRTFAEKFSWPRFGDKLKKYCLDAVMHKRETKNCE